MGRTKRKLERCEEEEEEEDEGEESNNKMKKNLTPRCVFGWKSYWPPV
jgi:hypothetical protein